MIIQTTQKQLDQKTILPPKIYDVALKRWGQKYCDEHLIREEPKKKNKPKRYAHIKSDYYIVGERKIFFKSKMEANYALYLEFLKKRKDLIDWQYESKTFVFEKILFGTRSYKPDFVVVRNNGKTEYHECKGFMDSKSKTKLNRMRIYFPNEKVILIGRKEYKALEKWKMLLGWY